VVLSQPLSGFRNEMGGERFGSARLLQWKSARSEPLPEREARLRSASAQEMTRRRSPLKRRLQIRCRSRTAFWFQNARRERARRMAEGRNYRRRSCREVVVHRFVKLDANGRILMVEQKENARAFLLAHADFDVFGYFEQEVAARSFGAARRRGRCKRLVAHGANVNSLAETEGVHGHGGVPA